MMQNSPTAMPTYFQPSHKIILPYALMDLDDTLFQTQRKIDVWDLPTSDADKLVCASVNKQNEPLSFMSIRQATMFNWLLASTELIAVTARDTTEIKRVKLPFNSWQVLTHGAVIIQPDGTRQPDWQAQIRSELAPLQEQLSQLIDAIAAFNDTQNAELKLTVHDDIFCDERLIIYLAVKHSQRDHQALADFATQLSELSANITDDFYIHLNANNMAILPHSIHKQHAVQFLLEHCLDNKRPSFGFGDSLADLPFLQLLDWYGTPNHGQLHERFKRQSLE
ncbi:HAD hydrolase family protein [Psychrobacter pygoscelis]|uniref:HAD hydrolase family protein n=1 Tax=Psychrobacter pygoscelis TaxID=2488563 RepID=UPI003BF97B0A